MAAPAQAVQKTASFVARTQGRLTNAFQKSSSFSNKKLQIFFKYAKVELAPPKRSEFPQFMKELKGAVSKYRSGAYKNLTVHEALLNVLVVWEIAMWFFVGEIIGKKNVIGYPIQGCVNTEVHF